MADDWQVGDLALCVNDAADPNYGMLFVRGAVYTVSAVVFIQGAWSVTFGEFGGGFGLLFDKVATPIPADPRRFRKIRPHKPDEEDRETIALLTGQPQPVEV